MACAEISRDVAHGRLAARHGHCFTAKLMDSQFAELEPPQDEPRVLVFDATHQADQMAGEIIERLGLVPGRAGPQRPDRQ